MADEQKNGPNPIQDLPLPAYAMVNGIQVQLFKTIDEYALKTIKDMAMNESVKIVVFTKRNMDNYDTIVYSAAEFLKEHPSVAMQNQINSALELSREITEYLTTLQNILNNNIQKGGTLYNNNIGILKKQLSISSTFKYNLNTILQQVIAQVSTVNKTSIRDRDNRLIDSIEDILTSIDQIKYEKSLDDILSTEHNTLSFLNKLRNPLAKKQKSINKLKVFIEMLYIKLYNLLIWISIIQNKPTIDIPTANLSQSYISNFNRHIVSLLELGDLFKIFNTIDGDSNILYKKRSKYPEVKIMKENRVKSYNKISNDEKINTINNIVTFANSISDNVSDDKLLKVIIAWTLALQTISDIEDNINRTQSTKKSTLDKTQLLSNKIHVCRMLIIYLTRKLKDFHNNSDIKSVENADKIRSMIKHYITLLNQFIIVYSNLLSIKSNPSKPYSLVHSSKTQSIVVTEAEAEAEAKAEAEVPIESVPDESAPELESTLNQNKTAPVVLFPKEKSDMDNNTIAATIMRDMVTLEGPISASIHTPKKQSMNLPVLLLLGDDHSHRTKCDMCKMENKCYSLYKTDNEYRSTFLDYLHAQAIKYKWIIDIYIERWIDNRSSEKFRKPLKTNKDSALIDTSFLTRPCADFIQHPNAKSTCYYSAFRIHDVDVREHSNIKIQLDSFYNQFITLLKTITEIKSNKPLEKIKEIIKTFIEDNQQYFDDGMTLLSFIFTDTTTTYRDLLENDTFKKTRTYHEFSKVPDHFKEMIKSYYSTKQIVYTDVKNIFEFIKNFIKNPDIIDNSLVEDIKKSITALKSTILTNFGSVLVDIYTISRILKVIETKLPSQLSVIYLGNWHINNIKNILSDIYDQKAAWTNSNYTNFNKNIGHKACITVQPIKPNSTLIESKSALALPESESKSASESASESESKSASSVPSNYTYNKNRPITEVITKDYIAAENNPLLLAIIQYKHIIMYINQYNRTNTKTDTTNYTTFLAQIDKLYTQSLRKDIFTDEVLLSLLNHVDTIAKEANESLNINRNNQLTYNEISQQITLAKSKKEKFEQIKTEILQILTKIDKTKYNIQTIEDTINAICRYASNAWQKHVLSPKKTHGGKLRSRSPFRSRSSRKAK
jgi:hypothetical protein